MNQHIDDISGLAHTTVAPGMVAVNNGAAVFDEKNGGLEASLNAIENPDDYSISVWVNATDEIDDVPGDILSWYDPQNQQGFHLSLKTNYVTTSQTNYPFQTSLGGGRL